MRNRNREIIRGEYCTFDDNIYTGLSPLPDNATVTMAYIPFQTNRSIYDPATAFCNGTLFPVLDKPFLGCCIK